MKGAFVVHFGDAKTGREQGSIDVAREVDDYWMKQAASGKCTEPTWMWSSMGASTWFVEGDIETLSMLVQTPDVQKLLARTGLCVQDVHWEICPVGRDEMLGLFEQVAQEAGGR